jgi:hypothetical protein
MTRDSGSERPQRTVAELLAEYGGAQGDAPRRRRRRAEDDGDSAPQTIIERVLSDSGKLLPIRDDQPPGAPQAAPPGQPRRPGGHRSGDRRPAAAPQPAPQQPQPSQPLPPPTAYSEPVRRPLPNRPVQQPPQQQHVQQPPAQPQQPAPQFPPSRPGMPPAGGSAQNARPAAGPPSRTPMRPVNRNPASPPTMTPRPPARPPVDDEQATAVHPPLPDFAPQQPQPPQPPQQQGPPPQQPPTVLTPPVQQRMSGLPREATTEEFPPVPGEPQAPAPPQQAVAQQTRRHPPAPPPMESTQAHAGPYVDDYDDEDEYGGPAGTGTRDDEHDSFPRREDFDDVDDAPAGGREWFLMAGQIGAGAIAGAAVWLAFSWLWGFQPVLAVIAALIVIVGLVLGVRRWRRAEDLQTTVLAILAGLVVTVSPAALLLLHR